jgi:hypothetical protein
VRKRRKRVIRIVEKRGIKVKILRGGKATVLNLR